MLKKIITICLILNCCFLAVYSQNATSVSEVKFELISSDNESSTIKLSIGDFQTKDLNINSVQSKKLIMNGAYPTLIAGAPELLMTSKSIIIPDDAEMDIKVTGQSYTEYNNFSIIPSKGNLGRNIDPSTVPYIYGKQYQTNEFFPGKLAELQQPYILRDFRGQSIVFYPFQYNPVTKILRVYQQLTVKITKIGISNYNVFNRTKFTEAIDSEFDKIYQNQFINYKNTHLKYTPVIENGKMLIICYDQFISAIQPLVNWRNISGTPTQLVSVTTAGGTSAAIKSYINNYYNTNGLTFIILVGDVAQVPTFTVSGGGSDNSYAYLSGNDHYPEIFAGRISAETINHVYTQVQKILSYEKNPVNGNGWLNRGTGIASDQGPGDNNEYDYEHIRNIRTKLMNYEYVACSEMYDGNQGGLDLTGDPTDVMVANDVNNGVGIMYYTGHGADTYWVSSGFSNTNIATLTNTTAWPFIFAVACVNGNFTAGTCFAEAWMRAVYNEQPTGAIATLMSTINQSWNPPMCGQDAMIDILTENVQGNIKRTFGGIAMNGCMKMNDTYGTQGDPMTDTWNIFGDPSLMVRTDTAKPMTVNHNPVVFLGATSLTVNCGTDSAKVTLSINNLSIGSAFVNNGSAVLNFPALTNLDSITVVVTAYNKIPYIGIVNVIVPNGPFVQINGNQIIDNTGNNNGLADYSENVSLNVDLKNLGIATANNVNATLSTNDTSVIIINNQHNWGNIIAGANNMQNNAFTFAVKNNVSDQHVVNFNLNITDALSNTWNNTINITLNAPVLSNGLMLIKDTITGYSNSNGKLEPGETVILGIKTKNTGHSKCNNIICSLNSPSTYITVLQPLTYTISSLNIDSEVITYFKIKIDTATPVGTNVQLDYTMSSGAYISVSNYYQTLGLVLEDFETGNFSKFLWVQGGNTPWTIINSNVYEGSYSAKSGTIGNSKTSTLSIAINVSISDTVSFFKKVSCEDDPATTPAYDYLEFLIDNTSMGRWDGETAWSRSAFPVSAGLHTLKWVYKKDSYQSAGSDCAWLDYIKFPTGIVNKTLLSCSLTANDDTICENTSVQLTSNVNGGLGGNIYNWTVNPTGEILSGSNPFVNPSVTSTYTLTVTDINNSNSISSYTIYVLPAPLPPVITQSGNQLISNISSNIQWFNENGSIIGANNTTYIPLQTGNYYAKTFNSDSCFSVASNIINVTYVGIPTENPKVINVFPNPFKKELTIEIKNSENAYIEIFNSIGQQVEEQIISNSKDNKIIISISTIEKGVYFLHYKSENNNFTQKIIKIE